MKLFFVCYLILPISLFSQSTFSKSYPGRNTEANLSFQAMQVDSTLYFSGNYFDKYLGYWTGFFAQIDNGGNIELLGTELNDTIGGINVCNRMLHDIRGLYILGSGNEEKKVLHYSFDLDSIWVIVGYNAVDTDITSFGFDFDRDGNYVFTGQTTYGNNNTHDIRAIIYKDTVLYSYHDYDPDLRSHSSKPLISKNGKIYFIGHDENEEFLKTGKIYLICLDDTLNLIFSNKDTENEVDVSMSKGVYLDKSKNIIVSGYTAEFIDDLRISFPRIVKMDSLGNILWNVEVGPPHINNIDGRGQWTDMVESIDEDGYIVAGSYMYHNFNDTTILDGAVAKISYDGNTLWHKTYSFREAQNRTYCTLQDIITTHDGRYFISGYSSNNSAPSDEILDPPGFRSILLKIDEEGMFDSDTTGVSVISFNDRESQITVFPNPTSDYINISQTGNIKTRVLIYNSNGVLVDDLECRDQNHSIFINKSRYKPGHYYFVFMRKNTIIGSSKVIVIE